MGCALMGSFSSASENLSQQRPLEADIWSSEKVDLGGPESAHSTVLLVDQSSPDFSAERGRNRCRLHAFPILDISIRSGDICERSLKWSKIDPSFARFWPPTFFFGGGEGPQILGPNLSCGRTFPITWQFRGDRPTELGDLVAKEKIKTSAVKHKPTWKYRSGWHNKLS